MSDSNRLLELIEISVVAHGGELWGRTRCGGDTLQLFDGRVTLRAALKDAGSSISDGVSDGVSDGASDGVIHAHVLTTLHEHGDELLDACVFGMGKDREAALAEAALIWLTCVAGPIRSFLDNKPVCMTCQAGVAEGDAAEGYSQGDYGLPGLRAYVGPMITRGFGDNQAHLAIDDAKPWFRFAAASAARIWGRQGLCKVRKHCIERGTATGEHGGNTALFRRNRNKEQGWQENGGRKKETNLIWYLFSCPHFPASSRSKNSCRKNKK
ncbi:MAG: hypothetical protein ACKV2V_02485 [Blastocatellia bacterium]